MSSVYGLKKSPFPSKEGIIFSLMNLCTELKKKEHFESRVSISLFTCVFYKNTLLREA